VNRFNYHPAAFERVRAALPALLLHHLRFPLALAGSALLVVTAAWSFEAQRLHLLEDQVSGMELRVRAAAASEKRAERLAGDVVRLRTMRDRIAAARREVVVATNTIAEIGNELPPGTWLTTIGATPAGTWTIGGRSTHVDEIGALLRRVQGLDPAAPVRLVSIAAGGRAGRILDFVIGWDRRP
jgi:Tfp pilus assembly protein PilN